MTDQRTQLDRRGLFFSHELRVALWYILEEEFPAAQTDWMGGAVGGEGQRRLEEFVRKQLNKLHLASGMTVDEILRTFVVMLGRPHELLVLLEAMPVVLDGAGLVRRAELAEKVERLRQRIVGKLEDFGIKMMFTDTGRLVPRTVDVGPVVLARLPRAEELTERLQPLINSHPVVSVVFVDVDGLKAVNDRIGHDAGTASLGRVVEAMSPVVVGRGSIFRYGGDEFIVVLPNFDVDEASATAERLRRTIERAGIGDPGLTVSIGVASSADARTASDLIRLADTAVYAAKFDGKNRVAVWPLADDLAQKVAMARETAQGR